MQQLEVLDLGWCRAVGDADAAALGRLPCLRELNLARTQVCSLSRCSGLLWCGFLAAACSLARLRELHLAHTLVGQARHPWLASQPSFLFACFVFVYETDVACRGLMLTAAQPRLPVSPCLLSCVSFDQRVQVTDAGLGQLHMLAQLQSLNLAGLHVR